MKISVYDILGSQNASLHDDGLALYDVVKNSIDKNIVEEVNIDFSNIKRCSTLFLNASFGKLLADFGEDDVKKYIHPSSYEQILNFMGKYNDIWDNFSNKSNYQAYRDEAFA